ncbi:MAG: thiamine-phosphate kinase [Cytophagales bacterium]|nr:MAG: thiamine-phosphate kinase [Cytophagales bacterium]
MSEGRTELSQLGEFGLIDKIKKNIKLQNPETIFGIGDDAAVVSMDEKNLMLISTDMMVEGIHFDLSYMPIKHLGFKAVATNVSDIAAMNGFPKQITVSLALSNRFSLEAIEELYEGIKTACETYKIDLIGGDTTASMKGLIISITILGVSLPEKIVKRSTAQKGDIVCVTGDLGAAYVGLQILRREKEVYKSNPEMQPELEGKDYIIGRQLKPNARMDIIHDFAELNIIPTSMIDISDGLASELMHICTQSGVGVQIYEDKLPLDNRTLETISELNMSSTVCMLNGGEDYELLFTIKQSDYEKIKNNPEICTIGFITEKEKGLHLVSQNQQLVPLKAQGWVHF